MTCEHPFCNKKASEALFLILNLSDNILPQAQKSSKIWDVCEEHSGMTVKEYYEAVGVDTLALVNSKNPQILWARRGKIGIMTEKI